MRSFFDLSSEQRTTLLKQFQFSEELNLDSSVATLKSKGAGSKATELRAYLQLLKGMGGTKELVIHLLQITSQLSDELKPQAPPTPAPVAVETSTPSVELRFTISPPQEETNSPYIMSYQDALKEVISEAQEELWVSTYSFNNPSLTAPDPHLKPQGLLQNALSALLKHQALLEQKPALKVKLALHLGSQSDVDLRTRSERVEDLSVALQKVWPNTLPYPELYCEAQTVSSGHYSGHNAKKRAQHSKLVIADSRIALIGSANLSEAAYERNIEIGCLVRSSEHVTELLKAFKGLKSAGILSVIQMESVVETVAQGWLSHLPPDEDIEDLDDDLIELMNILNERLQMDQVPLPKLNLYELAGQDCVAPLVWPTQQIAVIEPPNSNSLLDFDAEQGEHEKVSQALTQAGWRLFVVGEQSTSALADELYNTLTGA